MKLLTTASLLTISTLSASAAFITYTDGITNVINADGPSWVASTNMFLNIIADYVGSPEGPSGATGATSGGFNLFEPSPGGGDMDITLLTWTFTTLDLYQGAGTVTQSPTPTTPGAEDYRYDDLGGTAPTNLSFFYDGDLWASGYITRFVVNVDNSLDADATGSGEAVLTTNTVAGQPFINEINTLSGGTMLLTFTADSFTPISPTDPGTFGSAGQINIVPEPQTYAIIAGVMALGLAMLRRRRSV